MASSSSSSSHRHGLHDLLTTYYITNDTHEDHTVETARAGSSMLAPQRDAEDSTIESQQGEDVVLDDTNPMHRIDETPKLIAKPRAAVTRVRDETIKVLRNLQTTPAEDLRGERYDYYRARWFNTTRDSELELVEHVLLHPNHRPCFFAMPCRQLEIEDVGRLILKSLLPEPRETGQCLARFAIKTVIDMPFQVLHEMLETLAAENDGFQVTDPVVIATLTEQRGNRTVTHRFKTTDCEEYARLEPELDVQGTLMVSRASLTCSIQGKRHVQVHVTYSNNASAKSSARNRHIELQQTVKCTNRRVLIMEERNETVEYEIEDEMISLRDGMPHAEDLVEFLAAPVE